MSVHRRLEKIEKQLSAGGLPPEQAEALADAEASRADRAATDAYLCGQGPPPPEPRRPADHDPETHFRRHRLRLCHLMRIVGDLGPDAVLPGMTEDERRRLDEYELAWRLVLPGRGGPPPPKWTGTERPWKTACNPPWEDRRLDLDEYEDAFRTFFHSCEGHWPV
jgi:hypothetical protein